MEEQERLNFIREIEEEYNIHQSHKEKQKRLEELKEEYLKLLDEIKETHNYETLLKESYDNFKEFFCDRMSKKINTDTCNHDIYLYNGSYMIARGLYVYDDKEFVLENEDSKVFCYKLFNHNKYTCLHCGEEIKVKNWEEFEKNNKVLKKYGDRDAYQYYHQLYLEYLYDYSFEESQKMIIEQFEKDLTKTSVKERILSKD